VPNSTTTIAVEALKIPLIVANPDWNEKPRSTVADFRNEADMKSAFTQAQPQNPHVLKRKVLNL